MREGESGLTRAMLALFIFCCIVVTAVAPGFTGQADARADFAKWSNRSARVLEPAGYNERGTCAGTVCAWNGTRGIGNVGIGDCRVSTMSDNKTEDETLYPDYDLQGSVAMDDARSAKSGASGPDNNASQAGESTDPSIRSARNDRSAVLESREVDESTQTNVTAQSGATTDGDAGPASYLGGTPNEFTFGEPYPNIMDENPVEAAALYGKLTGLRMPDGRTVSFAVKSIGYEY